MSSEFLDRVMERMPSEPLNKFVFTAWRYAKKPTSEGFGLMPISGVDPEKFIACVMDVDNYVGQVDHVLECRSIADERYQPPKAVRLYELISVPMLANLQMELVLEDLGERDGFRVVTWRQLDAETEVLNPKKGARSDFNEGVWMAKDGVFGYALTSAPRRKDVGLIKFTALTKGADKLAPAVIKANINGMLAWAKKR